MSLEDRLVEARKDFFYIVTYTNNKALHNTYFKRYVKACDDIYKHSMDSIYKTKSFIKYINGKVK